MTGALAAMAGMGGLGGLISLSNQSPDSSVPDPSIATSVYELRSSGEVQVNGSTVENFCNPTNLAPLLECRMTINSGFLNGGTINTWLSLVSSRQWYVQQVGIGVSTCNCTIEIREAASGIVRASAAITFHAEVFG
ncbi:MAG: hypothetical protein J7498_05540 [Sphingobium sp.]|nr:hypothetical protein [Sphingobium sp.]